MKKSYNFFAGIDEAGRGPIAGPVAVGVVKLSGKWKDGDFGLKNGKDFKDSKQLSEEAREVIFAEMKRLRRAGKLDFAVSMVSAPVIDRIRMTKAVNLAIQRNIKKLGLSPKNTFVFLDGRLHAPAEFDQETITKGDTKKLVIALASIAAKVTRDRYMVRQAKKYPGYGFEQHKGYGTRGHYRALKKQGASDLHRKSYL